MKLSGVNSLQYYSNVADKRLLIVNESPYYGELCEEGGVEITQYIDTLIQEMPAEECLDIFLELPYGKGLSNLDSPNSHFLKENLKSTAARLETSKIARNLKKRRVRVHNTDTTYIQKGNSKLRFDVLQSVFESDFDIFERIDLRDVRGMIEYLLFINREKNEKHMAKIFNALNFYNKTSLNELRAWLPEYDKIVYKQLLKIDTTLISPQQLLLGLKQVYFNYIDNYGDYDEKYDERVIWIMKLVPINLYNLARMFVKFDGNKKRSNCSTTKVENIIIYSNLEGSPAFYQHFFDNVFRVDPDVKSANHIDNPKYFCLTVRDFDFWNYVDRKDTYDQLAGKSEKMYPPTRPDNDEEEDAVVYQTPSEYPSETHTSEEEDSAGEMLTYKYGRL